MNICSSILFLEELGCLCFSPPKLGFLVNSGQCLGACYLQLGSLDGDYLCVNCWSSRLLTSLRLDDLVSAPALHRLHMSGSSQTCWHRTVRSGLGVSSLPHTLLTWTLLFVPLTSTLKQRQLHREEPVALAKWEGVPFSTPPPSLELVDWILCC